MKNMEVTETMIDCSWEDSNQQGVALETRNNLAPQPSVNTSVPKETGELVYCHISTAP